MALELNILAWPAGRHLETVRLPVGIQALGSGPTADIVLSTRDAPAEVCRVELGADGQVTLRSLSDTPLRRDDGLEAPELTLASGQHAEVESLRLILIDYVARGGISLDLPIAPEPTAESAAIAAPPPQTVALKISVRGETRIIPVDAPQIVFGRGVGNAVSLEHPHVSRRHAQFFRKPLGLWIRDLGSKQGTFLDGQRIVESEWPLQGVVRLSTEADAPSIQLVPLAARFSEAGVDDAVSPLWGSGLAMDEVRKAIQRYGPNDLPVFIHGETGTGKELVARALASLRPGDPRLHVLDCTGLNETLAEAALFGAVKGAYTGATHDSVGACEAAGKGTLFLDEIGELPLSLQAKLLRLLESGTFQSVGSTKSKELRARIVVATHRDLPAMVKAGTFRQDLYARLNYLHIQLPPLRARKEDIPELVDGFLAGQAVRKRLGEGSLEKLMAYDWPANVRELRSVLLRAAANVDGKEISPEAITFDLAPAGAPARPRGLGNLPAYLNAIERDWLERALVEADGVAKDAAKQVGMDYHAFRRALVRHGLPTA